MKMALHSNELLRSHWNVLRIVINKVLYHDWTDYLSYMKYDCPFCRPPPPLPPRQKNGHIVHIRLVYPNLSSMAKLPYLVQLAGSNELLIASPFRLPSHAAQIIIERFVIFHVRLETLSVLLHMVHDLEANKNERVRSLLNKKLAEPNTTKK